MMKKEKFRRIIFIVFAVLSLVVAAYHLVAIINRDAESPDWRHALFMAINLFCAYGFLKRPEFFVYFFGLLLVQQLYSHGTYLVEYWNTRNAIHWMSVFVPLLMPVAFIFLINDRKARAI